MGSEFKKERLTSVLHCLNIIKVYDNYRYLSVLV